MVIFVGVSSRYVRSLAPLTPLTRSAALRSAPLRSLRSVHGLAHSLRSLPRGTVEILEYVFTLLSRFTGTNAFFIFTRNTPYFCRSAHQDTVTAISFVALGTSVPDTFASKIAAIQDEHADNSIGNVTGSNAVNVFLGVGIAWSIAAIYHEIKGTVFYVRKSCLAFVTEMFSFRDRKNDGFGERKD